jgi:nicotinamide-nucleotide amidase
MRAIILSIGDELALGQTLDTNSQWLSARMVERAILPIEHRTIADDRAALASAIADCVPRCDVLMITGGLGPTDDDLTREALCDVVTPNESLVQDDDVIKRLHDLFKRRGRRMPAMNARQAQRPRTFRFMPNPHGTAPGLAGEHGSCRIFCLPGPPREMQPMFLEHVVPHLPASPADEVLLTASVQEYGMGESVAAQKLGDLMRRDRNPLVGTTASASIVSARIRAHGSREQAQAQMQQTVEAIQRAWRPYAFGGEGGSLAQALGDLLKSRGLSLATAESCTGGWLGKVMVDVAGSSAYYLGGWVVYSNQMKVAELGVARELIDVHGAVSAQVAREMCLGAMSHSGADCAVSITGIAGPDGGTPDKPVGTVYIAAALHDHVQVRRFEFPGERDVVRDRSVKAALQMLRFILMDVADSPLLWQASRSSCNELIPLQPGVVALLGLGANLGDRRAALESAVRSLQHTPGVDVLAVSAFIETQPVDSHGPLDQPPYLNGAVTVQTSLSPLDLLRACLAIEAAHGRTRSDDTRNAPRTLDIDLLLFDDQIIDQPGLHVPHPRMHQRQFALEPAAQIAGDMIHPLLHRSIGQLLADLRQPA